MIFINVYGITYLGPTQLPIQWVPGAISLVLKVGSDHPPPPSDEVKNGGAVSPLPNMSSWHNA
jgi:hypothetical protein